MDHKKHLDLFTELENNRSDGYETKIITQARELEDLLNDRPSDLSELDMLDIKLIEKESLAAMDAQCPYLYQQVLVTGKMTKATYDEFSGEFALNHEAHDVKKVMTSAGFSTLEIADDQGGSKIAVGHLFLNETLNPVSQGQSLVDYVPRLYSFAPVGSVDILADLPDENVIELLSNSMPEMLLEVEEAIWNAENECDALRRLWTVELKNDNHTPQESLIAMLGFIEGRLEMDTVAPYVVTVQGVIQTLDDTEHLYYREHSDLIGYHAGLRFASYPYVQNGLLTHKEEGELMIELNVIGKNKKDSLRPVLIPVRNIRKMYSIRESLQK
jgi:hypothetical protein